MVSLETVLLLLIAYLLGSFPSAYVAGRLFKGIDIRRYGSGNVGGANVWQMVSRWAIVPVGLTDLGKGSAAVIIAQRLGFDPSEQMGAGIAAIAGHNWSIFLGFTGGRGIGTSLGVLIVLAQTELAAFTVVALMGVALRNIPLAVGVAMVLLPLVSWVLNEPAHILWGTMGMAILMVIKRLTSNRDTRVKAGDWKAVIANRLLFDRDIRDREAWIKRVPPKTTEIAKTPRSGD